MKIVENILYLLFIFLVFLKYFAISKVDIQNYCSYGIVIISFFFFIFHFKLLTKKTVFPFFLYLISLFLSATYLFDYLTFSNFLNSLLFPLLFTSSYIYFYRQPEKMNLMKYIGLIGVILAYLNLIRLSTEVNLRAAHAIQSNAGNALVALLPFVILWKNKLIKYVLFILVFFGCLIALKRSGFIIFTAVIFIYFLFRNKSNFLYRSTKYIAIATLIGFIILPHIEKAQPMLERLSHSIEDGGSGRDSLIKLGVSLQSECNFTEWILGNGYTGFRQVSLLKNKNYSSAHNDFIEILFNAGIIAYICYIYIWALLFRKIKDLYISNSIYLTTFTSCVVVFICANIFVCTFIHFWYYLPLYCLLGGICAVTDTEKYGKDCIISDVY